MSEILSGFLLVDKPIGCTSHAVVAAARRALGLKKVGHTGTLDPLATGLLVLAVGSATKQIRFVNSDPKVYVASGKLGLTTSTLDSEGTDVETSDVNVTADELRETIEGFRGRIKQVPPKVSAIKIQGERAYKRERRGEEFVMPARDVDIHEISLTRFESPNFDIEVSCSPGTYIRTLIADIGQVLGCGAHMTALRRTQAGQLHVNDAVQVDEIDASRLVEVEKVIHGNPARL